MMMIMVELGVEVSQVSDQTLFPHFLIPKRPDNLIRQVKHCFLISRKITFLYVVDGTVCGVVRSLFYFIFYIHFHLARDHSGLDLTFLGSLLP